MAAFCHFYRYTPDQFRALRVTDFRALNDYRVEYMKALTPKRRR